MDKDTLETLIAVIGCVIGLCGAGAAIVSRWKAGVEKGYAAARDFAHLKRNQEQMVANLNEILKDQDRRFDNLDLSLNRTESMLHTLLASKSRRDDEH